VYYEFECKYETVERAKARGRADPWTRLRDFSVLINTN